jgi:phospholipid/cholesterol/gamma-HCH transport system substrate-binding protein
VGDTFSDGHAEVAVSRSLTRLQALLLGVVVLLGTALAVGGLFAVGSRGWYGRDALHVRAGFPAVRGVEVGTRVRVQGLDAGEVVALLPPEQPGGPVVLRLRLRGEFRPLVRDDSVVQIVSEGMLGGKAVEILPGPRGSEAGPARDEQVLASAAGADLADVLGQVNQTLAGIREGEGTLGKLARDQQAYDALLALLRQSKDTMASVQQDADALKRLPVVGSYVEDVPGLLVRPRYERNRRAFAEAELFEPGRAVLTAQGRQRLDEVAPWLEGLKHKGSEVVVVAYADPQGPLSPPAARALTRGQAEAVCDYLKGHHAVQKMGVFSSRKVTPLGMGTSPPPEPAPAPAPPARVEILVFVPQI